MDCPRCHLPQEDVAWQCDGCGHVFERDLAAVRSRLEVELVRSRVALWVTSAISVAIAGGLVYLATLGWIYISVPLLLALVGGLSHAAHSLSVVRGHLKELDRRHVPLPIATARPDSADR